jgi:hypothetical protein
MRKAGIVLAIVVLLFAFLNPTNSDFKNYLEANDYVTVKSEDLSYGRAENYIIFSIYKFNDATEGMNGRYVTTTTFIGFLKNFKKLKTAPNNGRD